MFILQIQLELQLRLSTLPGSTGAALAESYEYDEVTATLSQTARGSSPTKVNEYMLLIMTLCYS